MKIDKIIFSSSEEFSPFWNLQSFIWKEIFQIEPVCILWGDVKNTDMSDKYGTIIEKKYNPNLIKSFQLTWSKFYNTSIEPDSTWIIGDMDLYPLQTELFKEVIENLDDDFYTHLASNVVTPQRYELNGGYLPAYYHVAKGSTFSKALSLRDSSFEDQVYNISNDERFTYVNEWSQDTAEKKFGSESGNKVLVEKKELLYWLTDEKFTSFKIYDSHKKNKINFKTCADYRIIPHRCSAQTRIDRVSFRNSNYSNYDPLMLANNQLIDIHCHRPFHSQKKSLYEIIEKCFKTKVPK